VIALLLTVSFTFLAATLPRCATLIATEFISRSLPAAAANTDDPALYKARIYSSVQLALAATDLLMYANHAVNFFLYCATGHKFRQQLCSVVLFVVRRPWINATPPSRLNAASEAGGRRRRRVPRSDSVQRDYTMTRRSVDRHTAV